eukprot:GDKH01016324.1.p1 GENE.GDKH01016324.1~~GDKH01016324.1.p1  ORF type:complete len:136 (-),score=9.58 GDKH01016324.1:83-490(-)
MSGVKRKMALKASVMDLGWLILFSVLATYVDCERYMVPPDLAVSLARLSDPLTVERLIKGRDMVAPEMCFDDHGLVVSCCGQRGDFADHCFDAEFSFQRCCSALLAKGEGSGHEVPVYIPENETTNPLEASMVLY